MGLFFSSRDWGTHQNRRKAQCTKISRALIKTHTRAFRTSDWAEGLPSKRTLTIRTQQKWLIHNAVNQWCSRGHMQVYAICLLFSYGCLRITTSKDRYLRIPLVYPLVLLLCKSVIYCSFPYNAVPYSCVKLVILCCNWCIITSIILPFPVHHRLSARVCCMNSTQWRFCFSPTSRESLLAIESTGTFPVDRSPIGRPAPH